MGLDQISSLSLKKNIYFKFGKSFYEYNRFDQMYYSANNRAIAMSEGRLNCLVIRDYVTLCITLCKYMYLHNYVEHLATRQKRTSGTKRNNVRKG